MATMVDLDILTILERGNFNEDSTVMFEFEWQEYYCNCFLQNGTWAFGTSQLKINFEEHLIYGESIWELFFVITFGE